MDPFEGTSKEQIEIAADRAYRTDLEHVLRSVGMDPDEIASHIRRITGKTVQDLPDLGTRNATTHQIERHQAPAKTPEDLIAEALKLQASYLQIIRGSDGEKTPPTPATTKKTKETIEKEQKIVTAAIRLAEQLALPSRKPYILIDVIKTKISIRYTITDHSSLLYMLDDLVEATGNHLTGATTVTGQITPTDMAHLVFKTLIDSLLGKLPNHKVLEHFSAEINTRQPNKTSIQITHTAKKNHGNTRHIEIEIIKVET
ncbi:MAG: hypothetical protein AAB373_02225 [Patescibacteria group bacterium]